jgi:hypothetical protein
VQARTNQPFFINLASILSFNRVHLNSVLLYIDLEIRSKKIKISDEIVIIISNEPSAMKNLTAQP